MSYVYLYMHPVTFLPIYVGKGTGRRMQKHWHRSIMDKKRGRHPYFYNKLRKMRREGIRPLTTKVFEGSEEACFEVEKHLIASYGRKCANDGILYNLTLGGEGDKGHIKSEEQRAGQSSRMKALWKTPEFRQKIAEARKLRKAPASRRAIEGFDVNTGEIVNSFSSITEAKASGFRSVCDALSGRSKTSKGLGWRYV